MMEVNEYGEQLKEYAGVGKAISTILVRTGEGALTPEEAIIEHDALLAMVDGDFEVLSAASQLFLKIAIEVIAEAIETSQEKVVEAIYEYLIEDIEEKYSGD